MKKMTTVEWLEQKLTSLSELKRNHQGLVMCYVNVEVLNVLFENAKSMEEKEHTIIRHEAFELGRRKIVY